MRNVCAFIGGMLLITMVALVPEIASAATPFSDETAADLTLESNSIITQSMHALMFALGWVAGAFR